MLTTRDKIWLWLEILFSIPFCAIGIGAVILCVTLLWIGKSQGVFVVLTAGLAFGGAGFALLARAISNFRREKREPAIAIPPPDQPWLWRQDWASGRIMSSGKKVLLILWMFTAVWNLMCAPTIPVLVDAVFIKGKGAAAIAFIFPLVGLVVLAYTVRLTMIKRRYGESYFVMQKVPGVAGGSIRGSIVVAKNLSPENPVEVRLSCLQRELTTTGKKQSTTENLLWQDGITVTHGRPGPDGVCFPIQFRIPYESPETTTLDDGPGILWRINARSRIPGVDYEAAFEVPVYKTADSSPQITEQSIGRSGIEPGGSAPFYLEAAGIKISPGTGGGVTILCQPPPSVAGGIGLGILCLLFAAFTAASFLTEAPLIFTLVLSAPALLFLILLAMMFLLRTSISIERSEVALRYSMLGLKRSVRFPQGDIADVSAAIAGQSGSAAQYWIVFTRRNGKQRKLWQAIQDKRCAERLAAEIRNRVTTQQK